MENTRIEYLSTEEKPTVEAEFAELLPPLPADQYELLEADLLKNGCYSPIIANENMVVIDGHNRMTLCEKHGIPYRTVVFSFEDNLEAKQWAVDNQKARRNLDTWELGKIALRLKPELEARGKAKMSAGGGDKVSKDARAGCPTLDNPLPDEVNTAKMLADSIGVSRGTMGKIMKIDEDAPDAVKTAMDNKELSINKGYNITKELENLPDDMTEEDKEMAAMLAVKREMEKKKDSRLKKINDDTAIAKQFCSIFMDMARLDPTVENVRIWVENSGIQYDLLDGTANDARRNSEKFAKIADILINTVKATDWRHTQNESEEEIEVGDDDGNSEDGKAEDTTAS